MHNVCIDCFMWFSKKSYKKAECPLAMAFGVDSSKFATNQSRIISLDFTRAKSMRIDSVSLFLKIVQRGRLGWCLF